MHAAAAAVGAALIHITIAASGQAAARDAAARAEAARAANQISEAIALYREALSTQPRWAEGWWRLGMLLYDRESYAEAADALRETTAIAPEAGTAWVMLGLCEFRLGEHDAALAHIQQGRRLGVSSDPQFRQVMLYHEGLLLVGKAEFERAQDTLGELSAGGVESDELIIALGLSVLRLRQTDVQTGTGSASQLQLVRRAGHAQHLAAQKKFDDAQREYEQLLRDFPRTRNVAYALGRYFVATERPDEAVRAFEREIENSPDHVPARLGIAAIKKDTDPAGALPYAEQAVKLNPRIPLGHYLLGSLLLQTSDVERAIAELEMAERAVQDDPGVYYALSRAYAKAGRQQEAAHARAIFKRLEDERQAAARRVPD